jgi:Uma2 family endonuclease
MIGLCSIKDGKFMNVAWTQAAEGLRRRAFTVADVRRMIDAGVIGPEERFELIEGEIVPLSPSHDPHERIKSALILAITPQLPADLWFGVESSIYLSERTFVEPDFCIFRRELKSHELKGSDLLLVVEVADTSLTFDRGTKALLYASHGVPELWVIDVATQVTSVHTGPTGVGWTSVREVLPTEPLCAAALPDLEVRVSDLGRN